MHRCTAVRSRGLPTHRKTQLHDASTSKRFRPFCPIDNMFSATMTTSTAPSHFASIPGDALAQIIPFLDRHSYTPFFLSEESPFRPIFPGSFNRLSLNSGDAYLIDVGRKNIKLGERNTTEEITYILRVFGPFIREMQFPAARLSGYFLNLVATHCTSVSKLIVTISDKMNPNMRDVIAKHAPALTDLSMYGTYMPSFIIEPLRKCQNLRSLYVETGLLGLWEHIGENIHRISLNLKREDDFRLIPNILSRIAIHCPSLTHMYSPQMAMDIPAFFRFIRSFRHKLNGVSLRSIKNNSLRQVLTICPNLSGEIFYPDEDMQRLSLLADALEHVSARFNSRDRDLTTFSHALTPCRYLVSLRVFPSHDERLDQMGNSRVFGVLQIHSYMVQLKTISLIHCVSSTELIQLLYKAPNLISLDVKLTDTLQDGRMLQPAFSQLRKLQRIRLIENMKISAFETPARPCLFKQLAESVATCRQLEILQFVGNIPLLSNEAFRSICAPLRVRRVFCAVFQGIVELRQNPQGVFSREMRRSLTFLF